VNRFHIFLLAPSRHATAVMRLARRYASGRFDELPELPSLHDVVMGLLHLAETQAPRAARGDKSAKEIMRGLEELLAGTRYDLLARFAAEGGGAAKPSGAGGGDVVVMWSEDPALAERIANRTGLRVVDTKIDARGLSRRA